MSKGKLIVGITGGIGSGKTVICKMLAKRGFKVYNADLVAKSLYLKDKKLVKSLVNAFGKDILNFKGKINLHKLKEIIFLNKKNYKTINKIVHPAVIDYLNKEIKKSKYDLVLIESAVLFESGYYKSFDYIVSVYADKRIRTKRLILRDESSKNEIHHLMKFQLDDKKKMEMSDFVIMNNKGLDELKKQVDFLSRVLKALHVN
ncbi:MAG: Dephospho-CoA kinase [Ignavibacteria bacterium]|nr:Dephospho-CoA kinase [Ignavibacteria bacterium]